MIKRIKFNQSYNFIRVLSVFLALILWFYVSGEQRQALGFERTLTFRDIPVAWRNLGEDLVVTEMTENVRITLQGMEYAFDGLTPADLDAYVDLQGKGEGRHEVKVNADVPGGLTVVGIQPSNVTVVLNELVTTQMDISPIYRGSPGNGMIIDESNFSPREVFVRGPRHKMERIDRVVFNMDVEGQSGYYTQEVPLYPVDKGKNVVTDITVIPQEVNVWVEFTYPKRDIPVEAVFAGQEDKLHNYTISPSTITVEGPRYHLDEISTIRTVEIDLSGRDEDTVLEEVSLELPDEIRPVNDHTVELRLFFNN